MMDGVSRIKRILDGDRFGFASGSKEMIRADIESVLNEYFYLPETVKIELKQNGDRFDLTISAKSCALRSFNVLK